MPPTMMTGSVATASTSKQHPQRRFASSVPARGLGMRPRSASTATTAAQARAEQQARDDAGEEQVDDRYARDRANDDGKPGGRDDRPDDRGGDGDGRRIGLGVALLRHLLDEDAAERRGIGHGRAGDAGEEDRGADVGEGGAAAQPARRVRGDAR